MPRRKLRPVTDDLPATVADMCRVTGLGENTVRAAIAAGNLPGYRIGRRIVIPRQAFIEFCAGRWQPKPVAVIQIQVHEEEPAA